MKTLTHFIGLRALCPLTAASGTVSFAPKGNQTLTFDLETNE